MGTSIAIGNYIRNNRYRKANNNIVYPGLIAAWSAKGKANKDKDRAVLRDLTGNGHDIILENFAFNVQGSGYINPEYPDSLMFDGVDDYGYCDNMPILTDYTLIIKRKHLGGAACAISKSGQAGYGAFIFEGESTETTWSFGNSSRIDYIKDHISWGTSDSYNGQEISRGNSPDSNLLSIGVLRKDDPAKRFFRGAFYSAYLFDRVLPEDEIISFIKEHIDANYELPTTN